MLSSPGNLTNDRSQVKKVVEEINLDFGAREGFFVELVAWETHTWPAIGSYPQAVINDQFPKDIDIFLGMMGAHFGTPTQSWGSGTEEEFRLALASWKQSGFPQIMFYFSEFSSGLSNLDVGQLAKRQAFKDELPSLGIRYEAYEDATNLHFLVRRHLSQAIGQILKTEGEQLDKMGGRDESFDVLANYRKLLSENALIAAEDLISRGAVALSNHVSVQNQLNKDISKLNKSLNDGAKNISRALSQGNQKKAVKTVGHIVDAMSDYQSVLKDRICSLDDYYFEAVTKLQRSVEIVVANELQDKLKYEELLDCIPPASDAFRELISALGTTNEVMSHQDSMDGDLWIQQQKIIALNQDLIDYLDRAIRKNEAIIDTIRQTQDITIN